jgi:hypothetical protein
MFRLVKQVLAGILFCTMVCACAAVIMVVSGLARDVVIVVEVEWASGLLLP